MDDTSAWVGFAIGIMTGWASAMLVAFIVKFIQG